MQGEYDNFGYCIPLLGEKIIEGWVG